MDYLDGSLTPVEQRGGSLGRRISLERCASGKSDPAERAGAKDYAVFAYRRDAPDQPGGRLECRNAGDLPGVLALSCPVVSGNSGAPLLLWDGTDWRIAAVMVASVSGGTAQSLAALIPDDISARIIALPAP